MTVVNPTKAQYQILSYLDFNPLKYMLENFEQYTLKLLIHIQNTTENVATIELLDAFDSRTGYANSFHLLFAKSSTQATDLKDIYSHLCLQFLDYLKTIQVPNQLLIIVKILSKNQTKSRHDGNVPCLFHLLMHFLE